MNQDDLWQVFQQYNDLIKNDHNLMAMFRRQAARWVYERPVRVIEAEKTPEEKEALKAHCRELSRRYKSTQVDDDS